MPKFETYERYVVHSLLPAAGWQAVYWYDTEHGAQDVHCLALVHVRTYNSRTKAPVSSSFIPEDEGWDISAVTYMNPVDGWNLCIEHGNFCGLLPPGTTLAAFLAEHGDHEETAPKIRVAEAVVGRDGEA